MTSEEEEIEQMLDYLNDKVRAWYKSGEDVIISVHLPSLMVGLVTIEEDEEADILH